jgi:hypothetical protein
MKKIALILFYSLSCFADIGMELIPKGRPFRLTFADPREIQMLLSFEGDNRINAAIGNYFSIFGIRSTENSDAQLHFGLEGAGYFTMKQAEQRFPLETADGLIGTYIEGAKGPWQAQMRFTHISAHLADGSKEIPIPYSRETLGLRAGYLVTKDIQVYTGVYYLVNSFPILPGFSAQAGSTAFIPVGSSKIVPFAGVDLKWKQESIANPCFSAKLGIALNNPPESYRSFRFFYAYYTGTDPRGQYYNHLYTSHSVGVEMQI